MQCLSLASSTFKSYSVIVFSSNGGFKAIFKRKSTWYFTFFDCFVGKQRGYRICNINPLYKFLVAIICFILSENIYFISPSFLKGSFTVQNSGLKIVFFSFQNSIKITFCFLASSVCEEVRNFLCNCSPVFIVCN